MKIAFDLKKGGHAVRTCCMPWTVSFPGATLSPAQAHSPSMPYHEIVERAPADLTLYNETGDKMANQ
jgi:hypothetical protein